MTEQTPAYRTSHRTFTFVHNRVTLSPYTMFGEEAVNLVKNEFLFVMTRRQRNHLLEHYRRLHGDSACEYARSAIGKWRYEGLKMAYSTLNRLMQLVPYYMDDETRYKVFSSIVRQNISAPPEHPIPRDHLLTRDNTFEQEAAGLLAKVEEELRKRENFQATDFNFPDPVLYVASWMQGDDLELIKRLYLAEYKKFAIQRNAVIRKELADFLDHVRRHEGPAELTIDFPNLPTPDGPKYERFRISVRDDPYGFMYGLGMWAFFAFIIFIFFAFIARNH